MITSPTIELISICSPKNNLMYTSERNGVRYNAFETTDVSPYSSALNQNMYEIPFTRKPFSMSQSQTCSEDIFSDEKRKRVGVMKIKAVRKYMNTLTTWSY